jgi:hypothetical protein
MIAFLKDAYQKHYADKSKPQPARQRIVYTPQYPQQYSK